MLTRSTQVGEFYVMSPPQVYPGDTGCSFTCDLLIYDEESDRHVRIEWKDALSACCISDAGATNDLIAGSTILVNHPNGVANGQARLWRLEAIKIQNLNKGKLADDSGAITSGGAQGYDAMVASGATDCRIVIARPFIEHLMHSVIICVSGRDTGATLFGPADMQLSANTQVKTIEGHCELRTHRRCLPRPQKLTECASFCADTGHFKAVITKPQNVLVMRDVACAGYVAGCNTQWFAREYPGGGGAAAYSLAIAQREMMKRLSFADDVGAKYSSMLAFPCWADQFESGHLDTVMSVTTRLLPWEVTAASGGSHDSFPGGQAAYTAYAGKLNLRSVHFGEDMKAAENQDFISQARARARDDRVGTAAEPRARAFVLGLDQQRDLLPRPAPQVRPLHQVVHVAHPGPGPLRAGRDPRGALARAASQPRAPAHARSVTGRTRAGAAASRSRSRRPATRWSASSWRSTRRWSTRRRKQRRRWTGTTSKRAFEEARARGEEGGACAADVGVRRAAWSPACVWVYGVSCRRTGAERGCS